MEKVIKTQTEIAGRTLTFEMGRFAAQANAAVLAEYGETVVLATVVSSLPREDLDYFPLTVEYRERYYAGGRISTSRFVKRERRPRDDEVLTARLIDRSIRPLFPKNYRNEVQVIVTVLSYDGKNDPGVLGLMATSAALAMSDIPWNGPIGGVRIGCDQLASNFIINPVVEETEKNTLDLLVITNEEKVVMVEGFAAEASEERVIEAINLAYRESKKITGFISTLAKKVDRKKQEYEEVSQLPKDLLKKVERNTLDNLNDFLTRSTLLRGDEEGLISVRGETVKKFEKDYSKVEIEMAFSEVLKSLVRRNILSGKRPDGRKWDEVRELATEVGVLPRTHGSAVFQRGETQVLSVVTLGTPSLEQWIESMEGEVRKSYIHHYNMPPYSVGETGRLGWPSRREVGHGALAEKALQAVVPDKEEFPYMIRVVSEVMSSNGSTSMASVCGSSLALMDAGVPIKSAVAGIAMGLVTEGKKQIILTDIIGLEDGFGDMDFKIAGTKKGITALQMDVKIFGLSLDLVQKVFTQARLGRIHILDSMAKILPAPRSSISPYAPKIGVLHIEPETIGEIIGPGGRVIREIIAKTGAGIDVEDDGTVTISGETEEIVTRATRWIEGITKVVEVGEIYEGEVVRIEPYGAFVRIAPGKEGLVHVSEMAPRFVRSATDIVKLGQKVKVRISGIDDLGRIKLSMVFNRPDHLEEKQQPRLSSSRATGGQRTVRRRQRR